ncbi:MAG: hypothetical protein DDT21_02720 [Syntrophomonadaceae bacterium]|nr:hypothetical protein [Bacillota bacterium]
MIEAEIDDTLIDADIVQNVNACLLEYTEAFRQTSVQVITVTDTSMFIPRAAGHLAVVKITSGGKNWRGEWETTHDRTRIRIGGLGTFMVTSIVTPAFIAAVSSNIGVHAVFQLGMAKYIGGCFKLKDNDANPDGMRMKMEATMLINKASALLVSGDRRPGTRIPIGRLAVHE